MKSNQIINQIVNILLTKIYKPSIQNYDIYKNALLNKSGLEIGGPSGIFKKRNILPLYPILKSLDGCNYSSRTVWEGRIKNKTYLRKGLKGCGRQFISEAADLSFLESEKYDFILSSHCLEHVANPLKALNEWVRVLKTTGYLLLVLPHKDKTFDHKRPVSSLAHLVCDYKKSINEDDMTHLEEILIHHDLSMDTKAGDHESFRKRSLENHSNRCLHHHVFDTELVVSIVDYIKMKIISLDFALPYHIICLSQKIAPMEFADNTPYMGNDASFRKNSPFESDHK